MSKMSYAGPNPRFEQAAHLDICLVASRLGFELTPDGGRGCKTRCPACSGVIVLTANPGRNKGYCNGCQRSLSTIDLAALKLRCNNVSAVNWLLNCTEPIAKAATASQEGQEATEPVDTTGWTDKAHKRNGALLQSAYSHDKRLWLAQRGIVERSWKAWLIGDAGHSVALPWSNADGAVIAVNHRRIAPKESESRYYWEKGVFPHDAVYGAHLYNDYASGLIIIEGEFNAISLWQEAGERYSVISPGSAGHKLPAVWALRAGFFPKIIIWADDQSTVDRWRREISGATVVGIVSPVRDGTKYDANKYLQLGRLGEFLERRGL